PTGSPNGRATSAGAAPTSCSSGPTRRASMHFSKRCTRGGGSSSRRVGSRSCRGREQVVRREEGERHNARLAIRAASVGAGRCAGPGGLDGGDRGLLLEGGQPSRSTVLLRHHRDQLSLSRLLRPRASSGAVLALAPGAVLWVAALQ